MKSTVCCLVTAAAAIRKEMLGMLIKGGSRKVPRFLQFSYEFRYNQLIEEAESRPAAIAPSAM